MKDIIIDAMGDQCPIPVVKTKKALEQMAAPGTLEIHVDNDVAVQNLTRFAAAGKLKSSNESFGENQFVVKIVVKNPKSVKIGEDAEGCLPNLSSSTVVAIGSDRMGDGNDELGATLMKGFIYALSQQEDLPRTILFYNGGARLTAEGAVSVEDLKSMEMQGVDIMTCGTCLDFYGLTEKLAVGSVTNMYDIVEKLNAASKVIRP